MKKFFVGLVIAVMFGLYSLAIRHKSDTVILKPNIAQPSQTQPVNTPSTSSNTAPASYKDGNYTGSVADAFYGNIQVAVTISGGKITDVQFLQYPDSHTTSVMINQQAMPLLRQEAIQAQSANVQIISGATFTAQAFQQSLKTALSQA